MKSLHVLLYAATVVAFLSGCEKDDKSPSYPGYTQGVFIVNEGSMTNNNGSISYYHPEKNLLVNNLFESANGRPLGDVVQSFSVVSDTLGYIVVNNSGKIEVVSLSNFLVKSAPILIHYPRYLVQVSKNKAYVSSGEAQGYLYAIDLTTNAITDTITMGFGPESMLFDGDRLFVANSGGWYSDSTINIVNSKTNSVTGTINTAKNPADLALDKNGYLWVYCKGFTNWFDVNTDAFLQKVNAETGSVEWQSAVGKALDYASTAAKISLSKDGSVLYYIRPEGIYRINTSSPQINSDPLIPGNFYGLEVNPSDGNLYVFEASFTENGKLNIYNPQGEFLFTGTVGMGPNGAAFNL